LRGGLAVTMHREECLLLRFCHSQRLVGYLASSPSSVSSSNLNIEILPQVHQVSTMTRWFLKQTVFVAWQQKL